VAARPLPVRVRPWPNMDTRVSESLGANPSLLGRPGRPVIRGGPGTQAIAHGPCRLQSVGLPHATPASSHTVCASTRHAPGSDVANRACPRRARAPTQGATRTPPAASRWGQASPRTGKTPHARWRSSAKCAPKWSQSLAWMLMDLPLPRPPPLEAGIYLRGTE
jgi:hypothetical protein